MLHSHSMHVVHGPSSDTLLLFQWMHALPTLESTAWRRSFSSFVRTLVLAFCTSALLFQSLPSSTTTTTWSEFLWAFRPPPPLSPDSYHDDSTHLGLWTMSMPTSQITAPLEWKGCFAWEMMMKPSSFLWIAGNRSMSTSRSSSR